MLYRRTQDLRGALLRLLSLPTGTAFLMLALATLSLSFVTACATSDQANPGAAASEAGASADQSSLQNPEPAAAPKAAASEAGASADQSSLQNPEPAAAPKAAALEAGASSDQSSRQNPEPAAAPKAAASASADGVVAESGDQRLEVLWKQRTREATGSDFHVGPGDVLGISVPAIEQLKDAKVRVSGSHTIALPLLGVIDVRGMTDEQVRDQISQRLEKYMYHPEVSVFGVEYQSREVAVVGAVQKPGLYTLASRSQTVLQMVSEAGMTADAAQRLILIPHGLDREGEATQLLTAAPAKAANEVRQTAVAEKDQATQPDHSQGTEPAQDLKSGPSMANFSPLLKKDSYIEIDLGGTSGESHMDLPARPGDVIIIPPSGSVMVQGWVANAGAYKISPGMTVLSTVAAAGGEMFSSSAVVLRTGTNGEKVAMPVNLAKARAGEDPDPAVQSGDVVIVKRSVVGAVPYAAYFLINKFSTGVPIMW